MAAYRSSTATTVESATSVAATKPTGLTAGDLMVAFCSENNSGGNFSTPSGWTQVDVEEVSNSSRLMIFAKVADSSDAAASDFTFSYSGTNTKLEVILYALSGTFASANNVYAYLSEGGTEAVSDTFRCTTGITPTVASSLLIMYLRIVCNDSDNNAISNYAIQNSDPAWTERHDIQDAGASNSIRIGTATAVRTETTATGYLQAGISTGGITEAACIGALLAISDTANGTATPAAVALTATPPTPASSGAGNVTVSALSLSSTTPTPSATGGTNDALWKNTDKPSPGSITNTTKPV